MIDLSVIIISYNTRKLLKNCLESVFQQKGVEFEVIVVDNGSKDGSVEVVGKEFPEVKIIKNDKNLGFAAANNQGLAQAKGRYLLLLNSDTVLANSFKTRSSRPGLELKKMVEWMDDWPEVGVSTCRLVTRQGPQSPGGFFPTLVKVFLWMTFLDDLPGLNRRAYHLSPQVTERSYAKSEQTGSGFGLDLDWVTGAFFWLRREVYEKIGGLSEDFFMYVEEVEYCWRVKKAGWEVAYAPVTTITHFGGGSSTAGAETAILGEYQSLIKLYELHFPHWQRWLAKILLKLGAFLRLVLFGYGKGDPEARRAYRRALGVV